MPNPRHIIRSMADIPDFLDRKLVLAYWHTIYRVFEPRFDIRLGQHHPAVDEFLVAHRADFWAFITPENPHSQVLTAVENQYRWQYFLQKLTETSSHFWVGAGIPEKSDWQPERSCFILKIKKTVAIQLAHEFGQNAIVVGQFGSVAELWWL